MNFVLFCGHRRGSWTGTEGYCDNPGECWWWLLVVLGDDEWLDSESIWITELIIFADRLDWIPSVRERRKQKMTTRVLAWASKKWSCLLWKTVVEENLGRKISNSGLDVLTLRCLLDIQVETLGSNWIYKAGKRELGWNVAFKHISNEVVRLDEIA